jgi:multiple sugar transport system permease protein
MSRRISLPRVTAFGILLVAAILLLFPLYWMTINSFQAQAQIQKIPPNLIPPEPILDNWTRLVGHGAARWFLNSLIVATGGMILGVIGATAAGYAFAKKRFPGREGLFLLFLVTMMLPGAVTIVPLFILMRDLHLINTYLGMFITAAAWPFGVFFARQYMLSIPDELIEAAVMDGASEIRTFVSVVLPIARPLVGALAILAFIGTWSNYLWQLLIATNENMFTLLLGATSRAGGYSQTDTGLIMAAATLAFVPMLLLFLRFQGYFMKGVTTGAVNQ